MWGEGVGIPSLPQGGSIGQPPAYLLSSAAPAPFSLVLRDPRRPLELVGAHGDLPPAAQAANPVHFVNRGPPTSSTVWGRPVGPLEAR
jgi:hypothetical protein